MGKEQENNCLKGVGGINLHLPELHGIKLEMIGEQTKFRLVMKGGTSHYRVVGTTGLEVSFGQIFQPADR